MKIRITAVLLLLFLLLPFGGCSGGNTAGEKSSSALSKKDFIKIVDAAYENGGRFDRLLMDETAAYFYGFALSGAGAMRLAVEKILWLKGEGEDFDSLTEGSRYTDWDALAELCYASPYPYYFEGLIHDIQGEAEEARDDYVNASLMYNYPDEGLDFFYLKSLSISELYALRDELRAKEEKILAEYRPTLYGYERTPYNGFAEYLYADALERLDAGRYEEAVIPARYAIRISPGTPECWICGITAAVYAGDGATAARWLEESLRYFPDHEGLNALLSSFQDMVKEEGGE